MAVKIRLSRIGKKKVPFFRVVAIDSRDKRDGRCLSNIGTYDALKSTIVTFNEDIYNDWISKGAIPSDSAKKIYRLYKRTTKKAGQADVEKQAKKPVKKEAAVKKEAKVISVTASKKVAPKKEAPKA